MKIAEGYWNYYITFRVQYKKYMNDFEKRLKGRDAAFRGILSVHTDDYTLVHTGWSDILDQRRKEVEKSRLEYPLTGDIRSLWKLYDQNLLPEMYFDFDAQMNDSLDQWIGEFIGDMKFYRDAYSRIIHSAGEKKLFSFVLMPLKVTYDNGYLYCPVYVYLLKNGLGTIKLEMPLFNIETEELSHYPMKRWFGNIKIWNSLFEKGGDQRYQILTCNESVLDIMTALKWYVKTMFGDAIIDPDRITGFESILISQLENYDLNIPNIPEPELLRLLYRMANPEEFAVEPDKEKLLEFWNHSHLNINGIHFVKGDRARLIIYGNGRDIARRHETEITEASNYLQRSVSGTFDPYILLALAHKENEITIFRQADQNWHKIEHAMKQYYANANWLEEILLESPKLGIELYRMVLDMLENMPVDFTRLLDRLEKIEDINRSERGMKLDSVVRVVSLIFTAVFGLPSINETILLLKKIFVPQTDFIPFVSTETVSFLMWLLLILGLLLYHVEVEMDYRK